MSTIQYNVIKDMIIGKLIYRVNTVIDKDRDLFNKIILYLNDGNSSDNDYNNNNNGNNNNNDNNYNNYKLTFFLDSNKTIGDLERLVSNSIKSIKITIFKKNRIWYFSYTLITNNELMFKVISRYLKLEYDIINLISTVENPITYSLLK